MSESRSDENGLINPSDVSFEIATVPGGIGIEDESGNEIYNTAPFFETQFRDKIGTIRLIVDGVQHRVCPTSDILQVRHKLNQ
jgi:hypothetical protein